MNDDVILDNPVQCYLDETRSLIAYIRKSPEEYYSILRTLSMTKDNSHMMGYESVYKLYKALEDVYKALCDDKLSFSKNLKTLINLVLDKLVFFCEMIDSGSTEDMENENIKPYLLYCDKAVAGEIFEPKHLLKLTKSNPKTKKRRKTHAKTIDKEQKDEILKISSLKIARNITIHEEMIARSYIINNQVSMLKAAIADNDMRGIKEACKLLANDTQNLQNSLRMSHENLVNLMQDDTFLINHQDHHGFFVTTNDCKYMIPSEYIYDVICESPLNYEIVQNQKVTNYVIESETGIKEDAEIEQIPVYSLSSLFPDQKAKSLNVLDTILIVDYQTQRIGIIVDSVQKFVSVIKKNMPPAFAKFKAVSGLVFDEKYDMIPILNIPEIMRRFRSLRGYDVKKFEAITKKHINKILIVDDSSTTRQIEHTILMANNFNVDEAGDGIDAIEKMKHKQFDLILCDDDMPRMDGKIFLDNVRRMENYKNVPVVVMADTPLEKADAFVSKADFSREKLINTIKRMLKDE